MLPFVEYLDVEKIHVQAPTSVVLLCGGQTTNLGITIPSSLRDAFLKIHDNKALDPDKMIQAEDLNIQDIFESYSDILEFETDLTQITELVLLFCESEGSFAELGAFAMLPDIASRLLVIVRDKYFGDKSFVQLGPLRRLRRSYGPTSVFVINDLDLGLSTKSTQDINIQALHDCLVDPIKLRLSVTLNSTTFDAKRRGHVIKLIVGLIQEYGGLTCVEIFDLLPRFSAPATLSEIKSFMLCADAVGWVVIRTKGFTEFYFAKNISDEATIRAHPDAAEKNKSRRRLLIREHWKKAEPTRYSGIIDAFEGRLK